MGVAEQPVQEISGVAQVPDGLHEWYEADIGDVLAEVHQTRLAGEDRGLEHMGR